MSIKRHILSKSTFMHGCQCPLRLYFHKFKPELRNPEDDEQTAIFAAGTNVGVLAQGLFPGGINAEPPDPFSYHLSVEKTEELIKQGANVIYEAAFNFEGLLCAIDILVRKDGRYYAYEVKGSTKVKDTFIRDASFQYYVITNSGIKLEDISIVHLDNQYVRVGDLEIGKLFAIESIHDEVKENQVFIAEKAAELKELVRAKKEPGISPGNHCFSPYECDFTAHCWKNVVKEQEDPEEECFDTESVIEFLDEFEYPLHFFDFETLMPAIPEFDYSRPYQQIPFQYSLHIQKDKGSEINHFAYLGNGKSDPRERLIIQLLKELEGSGSIVTWNKTFEITRLKEMARDFPEYGKRLTAIIERVVDLMVPFRRKNINHPGFEGSYSLKKVLPVLVPELSYENLEVQEGGTASLMYSELKNQAKEVQKLQREQLLEYCHLDTWAMVKIIENLRNKIVG